jgi:signal transduction histidine kinase
VRAISPRQQARTAFAFATIFLLVSGVVASFSIRSLRSSRQWVNHSYDVENALAQVNTLTGRAGRLRTEYVDYGTPSLLIDYQETAAKIPRAVDLVRNLTRDNPVQQRNCTRLEALTSQRATLMEQGIELRQTNQSTLEKQYEITRQIVPVAGQTDAVLQEMLNEEHKLLSSRSTHAENVFWWTVIILLSALLVALSLFAVNYRLLNNELDARLRAEESLRTLSGRLLRLQDDERRKFARELHDSLGQYLAGLKMLLPRIGQETPDSTLAQCLEIVDKSISETRTISHLLHPPMLDEAGLKSAVNWYVEGFARRSGVKASVDLPADVGRLPSSVELAIFRVIQEALTNIHRHANASRAEIKLTRSNREIKLSIRDSGRGISPNALELFHNDSLSGIGLAGMRERIRELGGRLEIESGPGGTLIRAALPLPPKMSSVAAGPESA